MDAETLKKGILLAGIEGGLDVQYIADDHRSVLQDQKIPELSMDDVIRAVEATEDMVTLIFIFDDYIWFDLPWEVGDAIFQRLFDLGSRDEEFLGTCMTYYRLKGPEGDARLLDFMDRLDDEGNGALKRILDPNNNLVDTYRRKID